MKRVVTAATVPQGDVSRVVRALAEAGFDVAGVHERPADKWAIRVILPTGTDRERRRAVEACLRHA